MTVAIVFIVLVAAIVFAVTLNKRRITKRYGDEGNDAPRPWLTNPKFNPANGGGTAAKNAGSNDTAEAKVIA